ncbi:MAG: hypothetical protein ACQESU_07605 [Halobacteriota archaeon]
MIISTSKPDWNPSKLNSPFCKKRYLPDSSQITLLERQITLLERGQR